MSEICAVFGVLFAESNLSFLPFIFIGIVFAVIMIFSVLRAVKGAKRGNNKTVPFAEPKQDYSAVPADELYARAQSLVDEDGHKTDYSLWLDYVMAAAEKGNVPAQRELGKYHLMDDNAEALKWLNLACQNGDAEAAVELAEVYELGVDDGSPLILKNTDGAIAVIKPWAERGDANAQFKLAHILNFDKNDEETAKVWYEKAAAQDNIKAIKELAEMYEFSDDWTKPKELYKKAAELGDTDAMNSLGLMYYCGEDEPDYKTAAEWYDKAVAGGNYHAMCSLGEMYLKGEGVKKDASEAFELFKKADAKGSLYGKYLLGRCYMNGEGAPQNVAKAIELYTDAARYDSDAQYALGMCYLEGNGVKKNAKTAVSYLEKAASRDFKGDASYKLGELYYAGEAVKKDDEKARSYWRKAAENDNADAAECLKIYFGETVDGE